MFYWIYIDNKTSSISNATLRIYQEPYRAYSRGTDSGTLTSSGASNSTTTASGGTTTSGASSVTSRTSGSGGATTSNSANWAQGTAAGTSGYTVKSFGLPHSHTVSKDNLSHTHGIPSHTHSVNFAHTHTIASHKHNMEHTHKMAGHTHGIEYGIYEYTGTPVRSSTIKINGVQVATSSTATTEINLSNTITTPGWHSIEIAVSGRKRLTSSLIIKSYIRG